MSLDILKITMEAAVAARRLVKHLAKSHDLADQLRRSSSGVALQTAEGIRQPRGGANQKRYLRIAYGSAHESMVTVQLLVAGDEVDVVEARKVWRLLDRSGAMLWKMKR